jgi:eukaryotic-like serine/threonine-protein kinase
MLRLGSGRFELLRQVGEGGAGAVFEGRDLSTNSLVAIKLLHTGSEVAQERFETEIAVLAELPHPAIVRYIAHGLADDGRQYLVMEWLAGKTVDAHRTGQWPIGEVLTLARRVVSGLAFAALRDISHRDIKPENLFLVSGDVANAKILDFGLARRSSDRQESTDMGTVVGTPQYMSPEQARGDAVLDSRTDVFSLGSVLYACLCGRPPFLAPQASVILEQICYEEPMPIEERAPHVPLRLRTLVQAMMRKNREERPDWRTIAEELSEIADQHVELDAERASQLPPSPSRRSLIPAPPRRNRADYRIVVAVFLAPRSAAPVSSELVAELREMVAQHGMRVETLPDGTRMLLPELALATSEQAVVAARCALSLQRGLTGRAALVMCTGRAALGDNEPFQELIERATGLLANASTQAVHVDAPSAALLETRFELGGIELEGAQRTLERERSGGEAARTLLGQTSPFVGRERELAELQRVWDECVRERSARAVLVTAPPGGGKTRLLQCLLERLRASGSSFTLLSGRGDPMRGGTQFGVLSFAVHAWAEIASSDPSELKRQKLTEQISQLVPGLRAATVACFLGEMVGVPFPNEASPQLRAARADHQLMADAMLESWLLFVDALVDRGPTLLCIEDLHWADPASVRFVDAALRSARERSLLTLAFARPEVREALPQLWAERELLEVPLPKLDAAASMQLLRSLAGAPTEPALQAAVLERADGNPFFLEELVRGLATRPRDQGLPETVLAVVQARLSDLGEQPKRLIQTASIFGQTFRLVAVRALLGDSSLDLEAALSQLREREIIVATDARTQEFSFRQSLLRDAAYMLQPDEDRAHGHCLAAAWLEQAGEAPAVIADHYERGGDRVNAGVQWARAAARAFVVSSLDDALRFGARAVACGLPEGEFGKLAVLLAEARSYVCDDVEAIGWAERARQIFPVGSPEWWRVTQVAAVAYSRGGAAELDQIADEMVEHFAPSNEHPEQALAFSYTISDCLRVMREDVAERLLALFPKQLPETLAGRPEGCLNAARARKAYRSGNLSEALRFGRDSVDALRKAGALRDVADVLNLCGYFLHELGGYAEAERLLLEATQLGHRMGSVNDVSYGQLNLGSCYVRQGRYAEAERALAVALSGYQKLAMVSFQGETLCHLAEAQRARGELERARQTAQRALQLESLDPAPTALALARLSAIDLSEGLTDEALEHACSAQELVQEHGVTEFVGLIARSYVESLEAAGESDRAHAALRAAVSWIEEQAAKIDEPLSQRSFLEQVPEHAHLRHRLNAKRSGAGPSV